MKLLVLSVMLLSSVSVYTQTEAALRRSLQQNPNNIQTYSQLIELATTREQILKIGNEALDAIGQRSQIYTSLGNAYLKARDYNSAVAAYRSAINLNPRSPTSYNRLGLALMRISYYRQAEVAFKSAVAYTAPLSQNLRFTYLTHLSIAFENLQEYEKARKILTDILAINPNYQPALEVLARIQNK